MKAANVTADNGDEVGVDVLDAGTVLLTVTDRNRPVPRSVNVELDESTASAVADLIIEARRSACQVSSAAHLAELGVTS